MRTKLTIKEETMLAKLTGDRRYKATIQSKREYDIEVSYVTSGGIRTLAWLPKLAIREMLDWTVAGVAILTDYPVMAVEGDWSAVRDSSKEAVWNIFEQFIVPKLQPEETLKTKKACNRHEVIKK